MAEAEVEEGPDEESAQWMPICDDCDNPVEHYCTTCGDKLCTGCKDHHLTRRKNRDHQVVPYSAGLRTALKSTSTCSRHPSERYQLFCKLCQIPVCTSCIAQSHSGHDFVSISDALSVARSKAISNLETLTKKLRPRVKEDCDRVKESEAEVLQTKSTIEQDMISSAKELHDIVDLILIDNRERLTGMLEENTMPVLRKQKDDSDDTYRLVEKDIKDHEDNLRSSDPINLLKFMRGRDKEDIESLFPPTVMVEVHLPRFQTLAKSYEVMQEQFGSLTFPRRFSVEPKENSTPSSCLRDVVNVPDTCKGSNPEGKPLECGLMDPVQLDEFIISTDYFYRLGKLRHFKPDKMWISAAWGEKNVVLVDRDGNVLRTIDVESQMNDTSGLHCTNVGELIFSDFKCKAVKKMSLDYSLTTVFSTGEANPHGICPLQRGVWLVCVPDEGMLRVYDETGKVVREIGKGHIQRPYYVARSRANSDICISDNFIQVVVFKDSGERRFIYTGISNDQSRFTPCDLCSDLFGNILITDRANNLVHIVDRDGRFLQYLVAGAESISSPVTIDIDHKGLAWVGEYRTRKVKAFKYLT